MMTADTTTVLQPLLFLQVLLAVLLYRTQAIYEHGIEDPKRICLESMLNWMRKSIEFYFGIPSGGYCGRTLLP